MKKVTKSQFFDMVNAAAAKLHYLQGESLRMFDLSLYSAYVTEVVNDLVYTYQDNFITIKPTEKGRRYIAFPEKPQPPKGGSFPIFEVRQLVAALLGIALARQAAAIHKEPKGVEPESADRQIVKMVRLFMRKATPEKGLELIRLYKEVSNEATHN